MGHPGRPQRETGPQEESGPPVEVSQSALDAAVLSMACSGLLSSLARGGRRTPFLSPCCAGVGGRSVFYGRRGCCGIGIPRAVLAFTPQPTHLRREMRVDNACGRE
jgi:hypothetical protein